MPVDSCRAFCPFYFTQPLVTDDFRDSVDVRQQHVFYPVGTTGEYRTIPQRDDRPDDIGLLPGLCAGHISFGALINRIGHIRTFAALAAIAAACALLVLIIPNPWAWVALRAAMGAATAGLFVVVESWLNNRAANESRGLLLSMYIVIGYIASAVGQQAIKLGDPGTYELFLFVGIALALSLVPVSLTRATHPDPVETPHLNIRRLFQVSPTSVIVCLGAGLINSSWWGLGPVYAREIGFSVSGIASFMTAALLGGMLLQLPIGRLSDRLDRRLVIFAVTIGVSIPAFALALGELLPSWGTLSAVAIFFGLASTLYPLSIAYANDYLDPSDVVAASGGFVMIFGIGAVAGPLAASAAMRIAGPQGMFMYIITIVVLLTGFIAWRMRVRQWAPVVEKEPYVLQPELQTPGVISELDPRAEVDEGYDQGPDILDTPTTEAEAEEDMPFSFWLGLFGIKPEGNNEPDISPEPAEPTEGVRSGATQTPEQAPNR